MHLVVDIGNTRAKYAVFDGKDIVFAGTILKRFSGSIMKKIPSEYILSAAILSNTSQPDPRLLNALGQLPVFYSSESSHKVADQKIIMAPLSPWAKTGWLLLRGLSLVYRANRL
ncbi:MAG: hypothetical protein IPL08_10520 [Saprospiraceae bacterium]|nr:hypothetical protein [Saprospiraceae bacterium]